MKQLLFSFFLLTSFWLNAQVSLVFPKQDYVFDETTITFSWNAVVNASSYHFQLATDADFGNIVLEETDLSELDLTSPELAANTAYYWRVKTDNTPWSNTRLFRIVDFRTWPEIEFMLDPDSVELDVSGKVQQWTDLSGNGHHFIQNTETRRPNIVIDVGSNEKLISFNPLTQNFFEGVDLSHLTAGEIFSLLRRTTYIPANNSRGGLWNFGTAGGSAPDFYPSTTPNVALGWGRNMRYILGDISTDVDITKNHILNIKSTLLFDLKINQDFAFQSSDGNRAFRSTCTIGKSEGAYYFDGTMGVILMFNTVLSDSLNELTYRFYQHKYAPPVNLGRDKIESFCDNTLRLNPIYKTILWSDGSTADSLVIEQSGTYWVTVEDCFGNISSDTIQVQFPDEITYPSQLTCLEESIEWNPSMGGSYDYQWSSGQTTETIEIEASGDYFVSLTDDMGCTLTSDTIFVDLFLKTATLGEDVDLCAGNTIGLKNGAEEAVSYLWSTGSTNPKIPLFSSGEYSVIATNQFGCDVKDTIYVNIQGTAPVIQVEIPDVACLSIDYSIEDQSYVQDGSLLNSWIWVVDGDTLTTPLENLQYNELGSHVIHYTIGTTAGCFSDTTFTLTVKPLPIVTMQSQGVCQGDEIQFYAGQLTPTLIDTWEWNFGESGSEAYGAEVEYVFSGNGNIPITLIGTDIYGCSDTLVQEQTISPKPNAAFYYTDICAGEVVNFANQTTIDYPGQLVSRQWNFGDGTTSGQNNPQKPYASYGEYPVSLTVVSADGCSDYAEVLLKVNALPQVNYTYEQACARSSTQFTDASFVPNGSVADVKWSFNGQPPLSGFSVANTFNFPGTVQLKQTVKSAFGCSNAKETYIPIGPEIYAALSFSPNAFVIDQPVIFSSEGSGETSYAWDFGNGIVPGSSDTTLIFTEDQIGEEVTVTLWVSNAVGCEDSSSVTRIVSGREVDLAIAEVFEYNSAGYSQLGVRLKNVGQAPIESVELSVHKSGFGTFKETWSGNLSPGTEEIYVFSASPAALTSYSSNFQDYLCISGRVLSAYLEEENLENNELCLNLTEDKEMIVVAIPNPIGDELRLRIISETDEVVDVAVFDAMGRKVAFLGEVVVGKGGDEVVVPAGHWAQGVYRVVVGEVRLVVVK